MREKAPSTTLGMGPSNVTSLVVFSRSPVSILVPSKRSTRTRACGRKAAGHSPKSRSPATVRRPSRMKRLARRTCSSGASVPRISL